MTTSHLTDPVTAAHPVSTTPPASWPAPEGWGLADPDPPDRDAAVSRISRLGRGVHRAALACIDTVKRVEELALRNFRSHFVATSVGPVRVLERGTPDPRRPSWVFIHGYAAQAVDFRPMLQRLRAFCQHMVAIDMPGHGRSPIPAAGLYEGTLMAALRDVLDARVGLAPCVLVGNSTGGLGAIRLIQQLGSSRVRGLVLISPLGGPMSAEEVEAVLASFCIHGLKAGLAFVDRLYNNGTRLRLIQALGAWAHLNRPHLRKFIGQLRSCAFLNTDDLQDFPPTLLVWGGGDRILPTSGRIFFSEALPHAEHQHPVDFGHAPYLDRADALHSIITAWANKHPGLL